jgi:hypothetical protein
LHYLRLSDQIAVDGPARQRASGRSAIAAAAAWPPLHKHNNRKLSARQQIAPAGYGRGEDLRGNQTGDGLVRQANRVGDPYLAAGYAKEGAGIHDGDSRKTSATELFQEPVLMPSRTPYSRKGPE